MTGRLPDRLRARLRSSPRPSGGSAAASPAPPPIEERVSQLRRVTFVESPRDGYRLNLIVPTVEGAGTFGGIRTALDLFEAIAEGEAERRIISIGRAGPDAASSLPAYRQVAPGDDPPYQRQYVPLTRALDPLAIRPLDVFIATYWTTAELVSRIRRWQEATYGAAPKRSGYVIQDFEPGFYPLSAAWLLARATYRGHDETVAMFNTSLLRDHFRADGIGFASEFVFEPRLLPELRAAMARPQVERTRTIVVYGRPGTPRNAFPAILDGLRAWLASDPDAHRWELLSVGRDHPDIAIGDGVALRSIGKLDLEAYADLLRRSAIGISLMVSPHPSYPPLEMAHLGMLVLTNQFGAKDLSTWHENIASVDDISADVLAAAITALCRRFDADPGAGGRGQPIRGDFIDDRPPFAFAREVAAALRRGAETGPSPRSERP